MITSVAGQAAEQGLFSVDVVLGDPWFKDKTNLRDLRRFLRQQDLFLVNPREVDGEVVVSIAWGDFPPEESLFRARPVRLRRGVILVINGTSNVGLAALEALAPYAHLYDVKATSRRPVAADVAAKLPHVRWIQSELNKEGFLESTKGVDKVFFVAPPSEQRSDMGKWLAQAVKQNQVSYVVDVSVIGAQWRSILFARQFRDIEESIEQSGVSFTHIRCAGWFENLLGSIDSIRRDGVFYMPYGDGAMGMLSCKDVGAAAAKLLTRAGAEGVAVELTGPEALTMTQVAATLSEVLGKEVKYVNTPVQDWVAQLKQLGVEAWFADGLGELGSVVAKGMASSVSPDGPKLLGEMITFKQWAQQYKGAFQ